MAGNLYRDEMRRIVAWRDRLDKTSNWAVLLTASILTWAFSSRENPHYMLLVAVIGSLAFLMIEARRFRHYDVWRSRVLLLEKRVFAEAFASGTLPEGGWRQLLAEDLREPTFKISFPMAVRHRLRRMYLALLLIVEIAWVARITVFVPSVFDISEDARVGAISGTWVAAGLAVLTTGLVVLAWFPTREKDQVRPVSDGEVDDGWRKDVRD